MCIGLASGYKIQDGDKFILNYLGRKFNYIAKQTPKGIVLVHDSITPLGYPLGALSISQMQNYKFKRVR